MRIRPIRWILNRSDQAGVFMAAAGAAATLQRTLMPRNNLDQAIESGLSMHAVSLPHKRTVLKGASTQPPCCHHPPPCATNSPVTLLQP